MEILQEIMRAAKETKKTINTFTVDFKGKVTEWTATPQSNGAVELTFRINS